MVMDDPEGVGIAKQGTAPGNGAPGASPMSAFRAAMTTVSTTWAAADHYRISRALKITASILATIAIVALASFVAVALSLT